MKADHRRTLILSWLVFIIALLGLGLSYTVSSSISGTFSMFLYAVFMVILLIGMFYIKAYTKPRWAGSGLRSDEETEQDSAIGKIHTIAIECFDPPYGWPDPPDIQTLNVISGTPIQGRMNPDHCKDVSLRHVDFPLTEENISRDIVGKKAYTRTDFMILKHGDEVAVINVSKAQGKDLFRPITDYRIVSLPEDTVYLAGRRDRRAERVAHGAQGEGAPG